MGTGSQAQTSSRASVSLPAFLQRGASMLSLFSFSILLIVIVWIGMCSTFSPTLSHLQEISFATKIIFTLVSKN